MLTVHAFLTYNVSHTAEGATDMTTTNTARNSAKRQRQAILAYLETGATLTQVQAGIRFNVPRLAARINELRYVGFNIESTRLKGGFVRYGLQTDRQPFEQEFFDFLKKYGGLDWYIKNRVGNLVDGQSFKLPTPASDYIHTAFNWHGDQYQYWHNMNRLWKMQVEELEANV